MKKLLKFFILATLLTSFTTSAFASNQYAARITILRGYQTYPNQTADGVMYFMLENNGTRGALPTCATSGLWWMVKVTGDRQSESKQASMLMMAYAQGLPIYVYGSGQCASGNEVVSDIGFGG